MARLMVLLGGRAAEIHKFGEPSTRAEDDLREAGALARRMVERWGMTGRFELTGSYTGNITTPDEGLRSNQEVRKLLAKAEQAAIMIIKDNDKRLVPIAEALIERETLTLDEIARLGGLGDLEIEEEPVFPDASPSVSMGMGSGTFAS